MNYLEKYINTGWELNMWSAGKSDGVDWNHSFWTIPEMRKALKFFDSIAEVNQKEMVLYRGTIDNASPTMHEMAPELPSHKQKSHILSTSYSRSIADEFSNDLRKRIGYLHVLHIQPGVKMIDINKTLEAPWNKREEEVLLLPGYKLILKGVKPIAFKDTYVSRWEFEWVVY